MSPSIAAPARVPVLLGWLALACMTLPAAMPARAQTPAAAENTGPNQAIVRRASGTYRYETISDARPRGEERWQFLAHPDGSRTLIVWHDLFARNAQFTALLRVAGDFRPLEAFVSYWNGGAFKGSAHFRVRGAQLDADSAGPYGQISRSVDVPPAFSIGTHPVAGDGWHGWGADAARAGAQTVNIYTLEASVDLTKPVLGTLNAVPIEYLGRERLRTPAGEFETLRVKLAGVNDLWITPVDRLVVQSVIPARNLRYVLIQADGEFR